MTRSISCFRAGDQYERASKQIADGTDRMS
jgi:hypothetical protein